MKVCIILYIVLCEYFSNSHYIKRSFPRESHSWYYLNLKMKSFFVLAVLAQVVCLVFARPARRNTRDHLGNVGQGVGHLAYDGVSGAGGLVADGMGGIHNGAQNLAGLAGNMLSAGFQGLHSGVRATSKGVGAFGDELFSSRDRQGRGRRNNRLAGYIDDSDEDLDDYDWRNSRSVGERRGGNGGRRNDGRGNGRRAQRGRGYGDRGYGGSDGRGSNGRISFGIGRNNGGGRRGGSRGGRQRRY